MRPDRTTPPALLALLLLSTACGQDTSSFHPNCDVLERASTCEDGDCVVVTCTNDALFESECPNLFLGGQRVVEADQEGIEAMARWCERRRSYFTMEQLECEEGGIRYVTCESNPL